MILSYYHIICFKNIFCCLFNAPLGFKVHPKITLMINGENSRVEPTLKTSLRLINREVKSTGWYPNPRPLDYEESTLPGSCKAKMTLKNSDIIQVGAFFQNDPISYSQRR